MQERLQAFLETEIDIDKSDRCLLAVSGGADSMLLLHFFHKLGYDFDVAHVNYGLRGDESDGDQRLVEDRCAELKLKCHVKKCGLGELVGKSGVQEKARNIRYGWFEELCAEIGARWIATAHNQTDQVETILMHQLRGTGIKGFGGMKPRSGRLIRPMMAFTADEIRAYAKEINLAYREDSSNLTDAYTRNRIRHSVLPALRGVETDLEVRFMKNSSQYREWLELMEFLIDETELSQVSNHLLSIPRDSLLRYPHPHLMLYSKINTLGFTIPMCIEIVTNTSNGSRFFANEHEAEWNNDHLIINPKAGLKPESISINQSGSYVFGNHILIVKMDLTDESFNSSADEGLFDQDQLHLPLKIDTAKEGDRIKPIGLKGSKLVSDVFNEARMPQLDRGIWPVVYSNNEVIWVAGFRQAEKTKITESTRRMVRIKLEPR